MEGGRAVPEPRRLAAIMFTDIAGFTALGQRDEALALAVLDEHRAILRRAFGRHHGREVKTIGDGFLVELPSALDALRCAYDLQRALREFNLGQPESHRLRARVGIHLGDVVGTDGDIAGDAVNVASRVEPIAPPGGICVTQQVFDHVRNKSELELRSLGPQTLKNVERPVEVYRVVLPWEGAAAPDAPADLDRNRLAILPFRNMSPDPNDEYFSEGMTEELITVLSQLAGITVLARTSVMPYRASPKRVSEIARELRAGRLIEGSVRKAGNRVRITVQLLDGESEGHLWAENYDRDLSDIFEIQSDVARQVADALRVRVASSGSTPAVKRPTTSEEAYLLYLKGRYHWNRRTAPTVRLAKEYFEKALSLDPKFALAMVGIADCYQILSDQGQLRAVEVEPRIMELAERALEIDPRLAEAHATIGAALTFGLSNWERAEKEFREAIALNPKYASAHQWYSLFLSFSARVDEAFEEIQRAREVDPMSPIILVNHARALADTGRLREGIEALNELLRADPQFAVGHFELAHLALRANDLDAALRHLHADLTIVPGEPAFQANLAWVYHRAGKTEEAATLAEDLRTRATHTYTSSGALGLAELAVGHDAAAYAKFETAFEDRDPLVLYLASREEWRDVTRDPRFQRLRARMSETAGRPVGLPPA
jgi:adenylate cyclase